MSWYLSVFLCSQDDVTGKTIGADDLQYVGRLDCIYIREYTSKMED